MKRFSVKFLSFVIALAIFSKVTFLNYLPEAKAASLKEETAFVRESEQIIPRFRTVLLSTQNTALVLTASFAEGVKDFFSSFFGSEDSETVPPTPTPPTTESNPPKDTPVARQEDIIYTGGPVPTPPVPERVINRILSGVSTEYLEQRLAQLQADIDSVRTIASTRSSSGGGSSESISSRQIDNIYDNMNDSIDESIFGGGADFNGNTLTIAGNGTFGGTVTAASFVGDGSGLTGLSAGGDLFSTSTTRGVFSSSATGLTYTSATGDFSLTSGYNIPLSASSTNWNSFYDTPSTRISAGTNLCWSSNTLAVCGLSSGISTSSLNALSPIILGFGNAAAGTVASAVGYCNTASGATSTAFGYCNVACGINSVVFGRSNFICTNGFSSVALGVLNNSTGGTLNPATGVITGVPVACTTIGRLSSAVGICNRTCGINSSAFGYNNTASCYGSSAFGALNNASGNCSSVFGYNNSASSYYSSAFGSNISNSTQCSVEIGPSNSAKLRIDCNGLNFCSPNSCGLYINGSEYCSYCSCYSTCSNYVGYGNYNYSYDAPAFGYYNCTNSYCASALGVCNAACCAYSSASGFGNTASGNYSSAFGYANTASTLNSSVFGRSNFTSTGGLGSVVIGLLNNSTGATLTDATGEITGTPSATSTVGYSSTALGICNLSEGNFSTAVGYKNIASGCWASAFGYLNTASNGCASAVGYSNIASVRSSSAFGQSNTASCCCTSAFGRGNTASGSRSSAFGLGNTASTSASAFGNFNEASGNTSSAFGYSNTTSGFLSSAFGACNTASATSSSAFGSCLTNSTASSSMIGFGATANLQICCSGASTGAFKFNGQADGTLSLSGGVLTSSSDERLKDVQGIFTGGLAQLEGINPILYKWKSTTPYDHDTTYAGFSAQNILTAIPEAITVGPDGMYGLNDRPILAASVNAIKELAQQNASTTLAISDLKLRLDDLQGISATSTSPFSTSVSFLAELQSFGASIVDGIVHFGEVVIHKLRIDQLIVGSSDAPRGITVYDKVTGEAYCIEVVNGSMQNTPGDCDTPPPDPVDPVEPIDPVDPDPNTEEDDSGDVGTTTPDTTTEIPPEIIVSDPEVTPEPEPALEPESEPTPEPEPEVTI